MPDKVDVNTGTYPVGKLSVEDGYSLITWSDSMYHLKFRLINVFLTKYVGPFCIDIIMRNDK